MNQSLEVSVEKVWNGPPGICYWTGRDEAGNLHRFVSETTKRPPRPGEVWLVTGAIRQHQKFGPQCHVIHSEMKQPSGRLLVQFLTKHPAFDQLGIGVARASALYAHFGQKLYDVLQSGDAGKLAEVAKIPAETIQPLIQAWQTAIEEAKVVKWLETWECAPTLATKLLDFYGAKTVAKLQDNPYRLLAFTTFGRCDKIASRLGIPADDPRRLLAIVQQCLYDRLEQGHTVTGCQHLTGEIKRYLPKATDEQASKALQIAKDAKAIIVQGEAISLTGIRLLELDSLERIQAMLTAAQPELDLNECDADKAIRDFEKEMGYALNREQTTAVHMALLQPLSLVCGGAGVGKTTVLRALCGALRQRVHLMALTGQAAKRITEATGHEATTIEMFLRRIAPEMSEESSSLLVVDEASMLDLQLTTRILRAKPRNARLLLVGDPAQLPPISFGLIFHKLAISPRVPRTELTVINRQTEASGIPQVGRLVREGTPPKLPGYTGPRPGVSFCQCPREEVIQRVIDVKADLPQAQICCVKNRGGLGIEDVNEVFHNIHAPGHQAVPGMGMAVGDPVIFKKNIPNLNLVNGSLGVIKGFEEGPEGGWQVICDFGGEEQCLEGGYLNHLKLAYALTVHSAQGSQFDRVIIVVEQSQLLDRTLLYTALTRGVEQVVFVGDANAFNQAVSAPPKASQREVFFDL